MKWGLNNIAKVGPFKVRLYSGPPLGCSFTPNPKWATHWNIEILGDDPAPLTRLSFTAETRVAARVQGAVVLAEWFHKLAHECVPPPPPEPEPEEP